MRPIVTLIAVATLSVGAQAQWLADTGATKQSIGERLVQIGGGLEWRFDQSEEPVALFPQVKLFIWPKSFFSLQGGIAYKYSGNIYGLLNFSTWTISYGVRLQEPDARLALFCGLDMDHKWYHGKTRIYSSPPSGALGWVWITDYQTGLGIVLGLSAHLNSRSALDFSLRKVFNHTPGPSFTPPYPGEPWQIPPSFPDDVYNPATIEIHYRFGL